MSSTLDPKTAGVLAEFSSPGTLFGACEKVRDAGYTRWDSFSPFPVHGLEHAMGLKASKVPWVTLVGGLVGASGGLLLQWWVSVIDYPLIISGKPLFSWQAFIPIIFELMILFAALGTFFAMLGFSGLPRFHHPLFESERFRGVTDDRFFIMIEADDPKFDINMTSGYLEQDLGATHVETLAE